MSKQKPKPGRKSLDESWDLPPDPEPSRVAQDGWLSLANDVLLQATLEAKAGDHSALVWLSSPVARLYCEALDLSPDNLNRVIEECETLPKRVLKRHEKTGLVRKAIKEYGAYAKDVA